MILSNLTFDQYSAILHLMIPDLKNIQLVQENSELLDAGLYIKLSFLQYDNKYHEHVIKLIDIKDIPKSWLSKTSAKKEKTKTSTHHGTLPTLFPTIPEIIKPKDSVIPTMPASLLKPKKRKKYKELSLKDRTYKNPHIFKQREKGNKYNPSQYPWFDMPVLSSFSIPLKHFKDTKLKNKCIKATYQYIYFLHVRLNNQYKFSCKIDKLKDEIIITKIT